MTDSNKVTTYLLEQVSIRTRTFLSDIPFRLRPSLSYQKHHPIMTRVSFITTVKHTVGDDFVREGILYLLEAYCGRVRASLIHKHLPITARPEFSWFHTQGLAGLVDQNKPGRALRLTNTLDTALPIFPWSDRIQQCDILVQSGAPIYWAHSVKQDCKDNEWWEPLIERRWGKNSAGKPFLNIAGGTCQRWGSDGSEFAERPQTLAYIRRFFDLSTLTTLRDFLSLQVLKLAGRSACALPCTSIFAIDRLGIEPLNGDYVALNYMPGGGHYTYGQPIDLPGWEQHFRTFVGQLVRKNRCILVCHDTKELRVAQSLFPELERFHSRNYLDYLRFYARARWGIVNRVHGAFALASLGKPATVVGTDSRAQMTEMIGLRSVFVNQANLEWLEAEAARLESEVHTFPEDMNNRKDAAKIQYLNLLSSALRSNSGTPS